jgi:hypothetical protein
MSMTIAVVALGVCVFISGFVFGKISEAYYSRRIIMKLLSMIDDLMSIMEKWSEGSNT